MIRLYPDVRTSARQPLLCSAVSVLSLSATLLAQTPSSPTTPTNVFDDIPAQYEAVFSPLDNSYLATGLLAERASS